MSERQSDVEILQEYATLCGKTDVDLFAFTASPLYIYGRQDKIRQIKTFGLR